MFVSLMMSSLAACSGEGERPPPIGEGGNTRTPPIVVDSGGRPGDGQAGTSNVPVGAGGTNGIPGQGSFSGADAGGSFSVAGTLSFGGVNGTSSAGTLSFGGVDGFSGSTTIPPFSTGGI